MNIDAIVYTSNAGHTKEYAELLSERIGIQAMSLEAAKEKLAAESNIIYMGWLMAGTIKGYKEAAGKYYIKAICPVGMTAGGVDKELLCTKNNIPQSMEIFNLQGGFEIKKLHGKYKLMMNFMKATIRKNMKKMPARTPEEDEILVMMGEEGLNTVSADKLDKLVYWYEHDGEHMPEAGVVEAEPVEAVEAAEVTEPETVEAVEEPAANTDAAEAAADDTKEAYG